jgi:DNA-binding response OmpR family regulator
MTDHTAHRKPRVLVVEDESILGLHLAAILEDMGCEVVGPASLAITALPIALHKQLDAAVLDIMLIDQAVTPVADTLARKGVPFVFVTSWSREALPGAHRDRPYIPKPFREADVRDAVRNLLGKVH